MTKQNPYSKWADIDGRDPDRVAMRRRLVILIVISFGMLVVAPFLEHRQTVSDRAPAPAETIVRADCPAEDEIPVETLEDAYGRPAGTTACVHVDVLYPEISAVALEVS